MFRSLHEVYSFNGQADYVCSADSAAWQQYDFDLTHDHGDLAGITYYFW